MTLTFRNVDVEPGSPVEAWPYEAIVTAIERGTLTDWVGLIRGVDADPWGPVARQIEEYLSYESPYGVGPLLTRAIARARSAAEASERAEVAAEVTDLIAQSRLSVAEVAGRIGTSRSRLSTYRSGTVMPSAAMLVRLRRVARHAAAVSSREPPTDPFLPRRGMPPRCQSRVARWRHERNGIGVPAGQDLSRAQPARIPGSSSVI